MHRVAKSLFLYYRHKLIRTRVFVDKLSLILPKRIRAYLCAPFGLGRIFLSLLLILSLALQPVMGAISTSKGQEIVGYDYDELGQSRPITAYEAARRDADQAYAKLIIFATFVPADTDALIAEGILTAVTGGLGNVIGGAGKGSIAAGKIDEAINSAIDVNRGVNRLPSSINGRNVTKVGDNYYVETPGGQIPLDRYDYATGMEKPSVSDPALQNLVDKNYRDNATVGSGSTADAVREEIRTGQPVGGVSGHTQKADEQIGKLKDWIRDHPNASPQDIRTAENMIIDLDDTLATQ